MTRYAFILTILVICIAFAYGGPGEKKYYLFVDGKLVPDAFAIKKNNVLYVPVSKASTKRYPITVGFFSGSPTFYLNRQEYSGDWFASMGVFYLSSTDVERCTHFKVTTDESKGSVGLWYKLPYPPPQAKNQPRANPPGLGGSSGQGPQTPQGPPPETPKPSDSPKNPGAQETPPAPVPIDNPPGGKGPEGGPSPTGGTEKTPPPPVPVGSSGEGAAEEVAAMSSVRVIKDRIFIDRNDQDTVKVEVTVQNLGAVTAKDVVVTLVFSQKDGRPYSRFNDKIETLTPGQTKSITMGTSFRHVKSVDDGKKTVNLEIAEAYGKFGFQKVELVCAIEITELGGGKSAQAGGDKSTEKTGVEILTYRMYNKNEHPYLIMIEAKLENKGNNIENVALVLETEYFDYNNGRYISDTWSTKIHDFRPKDIKVVTMPTTMISVMWYDKNTGMMQIDSGVNVKVKMKYRLYLKKIEGKVK